MRATVYKHLSWGAVGLALLLSTKTASAQYKHNASLETECAFSTAGAYGTKLTTTSGYAGSGYIKSTGNSTVATSSPDRAVYRFTTELGGFYSVFFRVNTNGNAGTDSFFYSVNGSDFEAVNGLSSLGTGWRWYQAASVYGIGGGTTTSTIEIRNREPGIEIDKVAFLNAFDPAPSGTGGTAYNCPMSLHFEAECPRTAQGAYPFKRFIKTGYTGGGYLYSAGNNTSSEAFSTDRAVFPFDSGTSTYTFYFRVDTNNSANDDSWFYKVDSGAWTTMNNLSVANGWRWIAGTATASLTEGPHTLEIRNREDGLQIDKIAFIPSGNAAPTGTGGTTINCDPAATMSNWNYWEQTRYATSHYNYFVNFGHDTLHHHEDWHIYNNDPGGMNGPGSGIAFLGMHRAMMNEFRAWTMANGYRSWIPLNVAGPLPSSMPDAYDALLASGEHMLEQYYFPRTGTDLSILGMAPYLTVNGGPAVGWWTSTYQLGGVGPVYAKLNDIPDLDTLGRVIGESFFHGSVHQTIGGTMNTFASPADPFFYAWHGLIDTIVDNWLKTTTGRAWMNANTGHAFLNWGFIGMTGWNDEDWAPTP